MYNQRYMSTTIWTIDVIEEGIIRYRQENGRYPIATDFDECPYLPSARQIQRKFGGMEKLRTSLGITETNYTKGDLRRSAYNKFSERSLDAEDRLEIALIEYFGEPYVHTQKRYYRLMKNRWDFFVYCRGAHFGIDIFTTGRKSYIMNNIRHKLSKYADVPKTIPIFFIVDSPVITDPDLDKITLASALLKQSSNIQIITLSRFLNSIMPSYLPLRIPEDVRLVFDNIEQK